MWESLGLKDEDILWTGVVFNGGIAGQQSASCGALSSSAVSVGLIHRCPLSDNERTKKARANAREDAGQLVKSFKEKFGAVTCRELIGIDFSNIEAYRAFRASGLGKEKCNKYVEFVIDRLYEIDAKRNST
jgi:C_GCAxxG_C_C family probable redox protein